MGSAILPCPGAGCTLCKSRLLLRYHGAKGKYFPYPGNAEVMPQWVYLYMSHLRRWCRSEQSKTVLPGTFLCCPGNREILRLPYSSWNTSHQPPLHFLSAPRTLHWPRSASATHWPVGSMSARADRCNSLHQPFLLTEFLRHVLWHICNTFGLAQLTCIGPSGPFGLHGVIVFLLNFPECQ